MIGQSTPIISGAVAEAIQHVIERHLASGQILSASDVAEDIVQALPGTGLDAEHLANQIMITAAAASVPVEIGDHGSRGLGNLPARSEILRPG
jgi:hypothetical protein